MHECMYMHAYYSHPVCNNDKHISISYGQSSLIRYANGEKEEKMYKPQNYPQKIFTSSKYNF